MIHFNEVLYPINLCIDTYVSSGQRRIRQIQQLIYVFFFFISLGHISACFWIYLGRMDKDLPEEERTSWMFVNDFNGMTDD